ncbi:hypothetical protein SCLCIDRAFT_12244 [Scleroderma citrinum Foug A]|uniref:Uncharacterized protein n=1 Tax=Scleroderma citrinum Foug A TaxID=1036808 RepID=A0A0C2ZDA9_9AGAM|nr:hypothetical protein SCLCIDRAFT_12244 [Scleroderma citrinum Foug A]
MLQPMNKQAAGAIDLFCQQVAEQFPFLNGYENCWLACDFAAMYLKNWPKHGPNGSHDAEEQMLERAEIRRNGSNYLINERNSCNKEIKLALSEHQCPNTQHTLPSSLNTHLVACLSSSPAEALNTYLFDLFLWIHEASLTHDLLIEEVMALLVELSDDLHVCCTIFHCNFNQEHYCIEWTINDCDQDISRFTGLYQYPPTIMLFEGHASHPYIIGRALLYCYNSMHPQRQ